MNRADRKKRREQNRPEEAAGVVAQVHNFARRPRRGVARQRSLGGRVWVGWPGLGWVGFGWGEGGNET